MTSFIALAFALTLASFAQAMPLAPLQQLVVGPAGAPVE
jgi:hypothetical protein